MVATPTEKMAPPFLPTSWSVSPIAELFAKRTARDRQCAFGLNIYGTAAADGCIACKLSFTNVCAPLDLDRATLGAGPVFGEGAVDNG